MLALLMDKGYKSENLETSGGGTEKGTDSALGIQKERGPASCYFRPKI